MPATKTTPAERIAERIAGAQPCTCGESGHCPSCAFDTDMAAQIIDREIADLHHECIEAEAKLARIALILSRA